MFRVLILAFSMLVFFVNPIKAEIIENHFVCQSEANISPRFFNLETRDGKREKLIENVDFYDEKGLASEIYSAEVFVEDLDKLFWRYEPDYFKDFFVISTINSERIRSVFLNIGENSDWVNSLDKKTLKLNLTNPYTAERFEWQCEMFDLVEATVKAVQYYGFLEENLVSKKAGNKF